MAAFQSVGQSEVNIKSSVQNSTWSVARQILSSARGLWSSRTPKIRALCLLIWISGASVTSSSFSGAACIFGPGPSARIATPQSQLHPKLPIYLIFLQLGQWSAGLSRSGIHRALVETVLPERNGLAANQSALQHHSPDGELPMAGVKDTGTFGTGAAS